MIRARPIKAEIRKYLKRHQIEKKFEKALKLLEGNIEHPSLNVEILEPKNLRVYSFRVDRKYRALFVVIGGEAEIITVTNHYK